MGESKRDGASGLRHRLRSNHHDDGHAEPRRQIRAAWLAIEQTHHRLDLWMVGEAECRRLLADAARNADLILIEAMMGLFDGKPSSADLAARFGVPVIVVISAQAM